MKPIQCTVLPEHDKQDAILIVHPDEIDKYIGKGYDVIAQCTKLTEAIEMAESFIEHEDFTIIMDDINRFSEACKCHMERGALMKPFLQKFLVNDSKLIMRTDEALKSLDEMIERIFS